MPKRNDNAGDANGGKPVNPGPPDNGNSGPVSGASPGNSGPTPVNPTAIGHNPDANGSAPSGNSDSPRKRGRPRGSTNQRSQTDKTLDLSGITGALNAAHVFLATISKNPIWVLNESELNAYAEALRNVSRHYDIAVQQKTIDHGMLLVVMSGIYGTRIMAMQRMKAQDREAATVVDENAAAAHAAGNVHTFTPQQMQ